MCRSNYSVETKVSHIEVHDLLDDSRYIWHGRRNYVELDPATRPAHIFRVAPF